MNNIEALCRICGTAIIIASGQEAICSSCAMLTCKCCHNDNEYCGAPIDGQCPDCEDYFCDECLGHEILRKEPDD